MWMCRCVDVWMRGCVDVWMRGCAEVADLDGVVEVYKVGPGVVSVSDLVMIAMFITISVVFTKIVAR